jgi:hypothetical protein
MLNWLKLSHHSNSGKIQPHKHTSYLPLGFLLLLTGIVLTVYSAAATSPGPESSSIGLTGTVPGKAPTIAAVILSPVSQKHFTTSPVTFSGTCPPDALVELFKNDIFAGSTPCSNTGTFSLDIDLLIGKNTLMARVYDVLNQPGPDSAPVDVFYDALPAQSGSFAPMDFGGAQLLLNTDAVFRGSFPEQELAIPIDILGGTPPYAVNVQWGDSDNNVVPRNDTTAFKVGHTYKKAGTYQISIQATDAASRVAFLTVASVINGQPSVAAAATTANPAVNQLLILWPLYTSVFAIVISFWFGERREKHILKQRGLLLPS